MRRFGIIGNPLEHSFSSEYFRNKFLSENITDAIYENFLLDSVDEVPLLLKQFPELEMETAVRGLSLHAPLEFLEQERVLLLLKRLELLLRIRVARLCLRLERLDLAIELRDLEVPELD